MKDDFIDILNKMGKGGISKEWYDDTIQVCLKCSRRSLRNGVGTWDVSTSVKKEENGRATKAEIGNLLKNFKTNIMISMSSQLDVL